jgi:glycerophosphoryl diester phosphodiesterase
MRRKITITAACAAAALTILMAGLFLLASPAADYAYYSRPGFRIIAHRGGMGLGPENTIETFKRSLAAGADTLEMDIRSTKDDRLVVIHDATVDRTTDGTGTVHELNLADIKKLDAGTRRQRKGPEFSVPNARIVVPTVAEVLVAFPDTPLVMEVKDERPATGELLCGLLARYRKTGNVLVASMHAKVLYEFRKACPTVATSAGPNAVRVFYLLNKVGLTSLFSAEMAAFQVPASVRGRRIATPGFVMAAHRRNIKVEVWTVNDEDEMQQLLEAGVDGIFTDFPSRMKSVVDKTLRRPAGSQRPERTTTGCFTAIARLFRRLPARLTGRRDGCGSRR